MIELKKIYKEYKNDEVVTKVLFDISLKINKGEYIAIMGPSGSGKSTLMHILGLLDTPTKGEYFFNNKMIFYLIFCIYASFLAKYPCQIFIFYYSLKKIYL